MGRRLGGVLGLPSLTKGASGEVAADPGSRPGIESMDGLDKPPSADTIWIRCVDYSSDRLETREITDLGGFLKEQRPEWSQVRWINVDGLHPYVVNLLREAYGFHTLAAEDVLRPHQRPKMEEYPGHLFLVARMLIQKAEGLVNEQVSMFLFGNLLLTFQEARGDVWDPIRQRLQKPNSRLRNMGCSYLLYALMDALVDHGFPILEEYGERLEDLEKVILADPSPAAQRQLHGVKRDLALLRRVIWPMRELVSQLQREETEQISPEVRAYMRDVYDHAVQVLDVVETYREMAAGLNDLYMSAVGNRMNEIMKVLTIMASFFIPITFVAGVYGMNFEHIPELRWTYSYVGFWMVCLGIAGSLALYFYRKGWLGRR